MTNEEIIARKAISEGLFTEEEIIRRIKNDIDIPLHTSRGWKERGYTVKKGEKGGENAKKERREAAPKDYFLMAGVRTALPLRTVTLKVISVLGCACLSFSMLRFMRRRN